jgi:hypothetical protein
MRLDGTCDVRSAQHYASVQILSLEKLFICSSHIGWIGS